MITIDDFVMLGKTVPEPNSDGRVFVCSAGVSDQMRSLVRIYPLARSAAPKRWQVCRVPLERNPKDSRRESFKIAGDRSQGAHEHINDKFEALSKVPDRHRCMILRPYVVGSIAEANAKRASLAILHPDNLDLQFEHNPASPDSPQLALFPVEGQAEPGGAKRFALIPRLCFHDESGWHRLMLRDWGCYELMRKHGDDYARTNMANALHLRESSSLLIGNLNNQRTAWLVISVLNGIREELTLFDLLPSQRVRIPETVRIQVYSRDGWVCRHCGSPDNLTVDHIHPHIRGGLNAMVNLQTLCMSCNASKSDGTDSFVT